MCKASAAIRNNDLQEAEHRRGVLLASRLCFAQRATSFEAAVCSESLSTKKEEAQTRVCCKTCFSDQQKQVEQL